METISLRLLKPLAAALCLMLFTAGGACAKTVAPDFVELAARLKPAVVNISTARTVAPQKKHQRAPSPFGSDPFQDFFERFFEDLPQRSYKQKSLGSGFIISDEGYILTNNHVVSGADEIKVKLADGREFKAEIKGRDEKLDLALLKIEGKDHFPVATLGDSDAIKVGEWVMAIGNPFGLQQTVTAGIISAKGRVIGSGPYDDFLQTDASINPGNSGGPLFNANGEVIGVNTAIVAGGQGIGFAIPINMAKSIITQLREKGKVTRGWIGVAIQTVTPELAQSFGLEGEKGALVSEVVKDGPADHAGIKSGDIILEFDDKTVHEMNELPRLVAATPVGKKVAVKVLRDGKELEVPVTVDLLKDKEEEAAAQEPDKLGMTVGALTRELAEKMGIGETRGVIVMEVKPGSIAGEAGIARGDIVREVNGKKVGSVEEYESAIAARKKGGVVRLLLRRGDSSLFVALKLD
ncbi:MAG: DegQ family serine endoprotease [Geobacteraceae bacterium]|nr:DegQ family serine endoprotease [Geobacteraceae bacterium]